MTMTPRTRAVVDAATAAFPKLGTDVLDAAEARRQLASRPAASVEPIPVAAVRDSVVISSDGADIPVRVYTPRAGGEPLPVVMFCHGGGFVICSLDSHDQFCRTMANETGALVVSVEYRQAPEHRFPAAAQDAYAVLCWIGEAIAQHGGDPARIAVAGDSAGGNLAAVTALMARDLGGPAVAAQLLMYPMLDPARASASYRDNAQGYFVTDDHLRWYWEQYLGDADGTDPYAAPLLADPAGLPPAHIATAEYDPLRDEGEAYGAHLAAVDIPVEVHRYDGMFHGFMTMGDVLPETTVANARAFAALRRAFAGPARPIFGCADGP
ncbi:alpha/beta hydrolase [Nocardia sp. BSTN01]|uniref:alpha/beta hydrolase n=1 Tax=Nocardia sp. BSTN01 TaxID=2783665 RepID=UPI00188F52D8|nr:alpha/beta hydrolase [Nocardia sp. BSTN01]MBF4996343.1 alpha/beta hydrolase [Nocardia sp. BSTN01]